MFELQLGPCTVEWLLPRRKLQQRVTRAGSFVHALAKSTNRPPGPARKTSGNALVSLRTRGATFPPDSPQTRRSGRLAGQAIGLEGLARNPRSTDASRAAKTGSRRAEVYLQNRGANPIPRPLDGKRPGETAVQTDLPGKLRFWRDAWSQPVSMAGRLPKLAPAVGQNRKVSIHPSPETVALFGL